jgi:hypothetical protein
MRLQQGELAWYLSGDVSARVAEAHLDRIGRAVLRGRQGYALGRWLRNHGFEGRLWLDLARYEPERARSQDHTLFGDERLNRQRDLEVDEVLSPGQLIRTSSRLRSAVESESRWLDRVGGGRIVLALGRELVADHTPFVAARLAAAPYPLAITLEDTDYPFDRAGVVAGMADLIDAVDDLYLLRTDLGALGAVAAGAGLGAVGTAPGVRRVKRRRQERTRGGPGPAPSVFVEDLLCFRLGTYLDEWPGDATVRCRRPCCDGKPLRRFTGFHLAEDVLIHNLHAVAAVADHVLDRAPEERLAAFGELCRSAIEAHGSWAVLARRPLRVKPHLTAWERLARQRAGPPHRPAR